MDKYHSYMLNINSNIVVNTIQSKLGGVYNIMGFKITDRGSIYDSIIGGKGNIYYLE